jgi:predicted pyridoxine 5'-phosphate oxidase superfamily flavin-nucleotide-binding protein
MSRLYGPEHRALQDEFRSRPMADRIEVIAVKTEVGDLEKAFIEARDMFFLSSVDDRGRPTVSYKGGTAGFVRVLDAQTIAFPSYDGNGMYLSMGNIVGNPEVGLLFIDFEKPFRLRLQGRAHLSRDPKVLANFKEAELAVIVTVSEVFMNCPRYVHRYQKVQASRYAPVDSAETPFCEWKRIDGVQDVLRPHETAVVEKVGQITIDDWMGKVLTGDEKA